MSLLSFQGITKEYRNKLVLDGVSLNIEKQERVALIGDNGSGKSTLLRIAMGRETPDLGQVTTARNIKIGYLSQNSDEMVQGQETALYYEKVHGLEEQMRAMEAQMAVEADKYDTEAYAQLTSRYGRLMAEYEAMDGYAVHHEMKKILLGLGLKEAALYTSLDTLSGGEKMRVALARILLEKPDLLVLDEPTNHLDIHAIQWLEAYLCKFSGGVLIVSHDRYFLDRVATRIAELSHGTLLEKRCSYSQFIEQKEIARSFYLKEQKNLRVQIRDLEELIRNLRRQRKSKQADSRTHELQRLKDKLAHNQQKVRTAGHLQKTNGPALRIQAHGHVSKEIAWAEGLTKSFGDHTLFEDISFHIAGGERIALIGPNGCGKTTLLNILRGLDRDFSGTAKLGTWVSYAYLGQSVYFPDMDRTVLEELMIDGKLEEAAARKHLARFQFYGDVVNSTLHVLSGGEKVRLYLAEVMLRNPHCLILDEPTNHLDLSSREALELAINEFRGTVIAVSHDRYYLNNCVDRLIAFQNGSVRVFDGNYDAYLATVSKEEGAAAVGGHSPQRKDMSKATSPSSNTKVIAQKKQAPSLEDIESSILATEERIDQLQRKVLRDGENEDYEELGQLVNQLTELYEAYAAL